MQNHINRRKLYKAKQKMQYKITTCTVYTTLRHWRKVFENPCYNNFYYPFYIICVQPIWGIPPQVVTLLVFNHLRHFSSSCNIICPQPLWGIFPQVLTLFVLNLFEVFLFKLCSTSLRYFSPSCNIFFAQLLWGFSPRVAALFLRTSSAQLGPHRSIAYLLFSQTPAETSCFVHLIFFVRSKSHHCMLLSFVF